MRRLEDYKSQIICALTDIVRFAENSINAGRSNFLRDAEEFYRGLLNLFYDWDLSNANNESNPNYPGVDLMYLGGEIAVQVTIETDAQKVHDSINGFKSKALKEGYKELYILMFRGKPKFPHVDFKKSTESKFIFDKEKHIIDHTDLCAKIRDAEFDFVEKIYKYLDKHGCLEILKDFNQSNFNTHDKLIFEKIEKICPEEELIHTIKYVYEMMRVTDVQLMKWDEIVIFHTYESNKFLSQQLNEIFGDFLDALFNFQVYCTKIRNDDILKDGIQTLLLSKRQSWESYDEYDKRWRIESEHLVALGESAIGAFKEFRKSVKQILL